MSRRAAAWTTTAATTLLGAVASLSVGVWSGWKPFGLTLFDLLDYVTANILLPVGGLFTCIFVGWKLDQQYSRIRLPTTDAEVPHLHALHRIVALLLSAGHADALSGQSGGLLIPLVWGGVIRIPTDTEATACRGQRPDPDMAKKGTLHNAMSLFNDFQENFSPFAVSSSRPYISEPFGFYSACYFRLLDGFLLQDAFASLQPPRDRPRVS